MKNTIIIGNWKMNKTYSESVKYVEDFEKLYKQNSNKIIPNLTFGVAVPFTSLAVSKLNKVNELNFGAQDMALHEKGAYTSEVSSDMIVDLGAKYVILGHSEVRSYHCETDEIVNQKAKLAIAKGLTPIVCVGETLEEYESGRTKEVVAQQLALSLKDLDLSKIVLAYEPIWAIGTGKVATPEIAEDVCKFIKEKTSKDLIVQYGGSVSPKNIKELHDQPSIDGFLVGGASLEPESFLALLTLGK
ncbi:triose-phosphate isomerase [Mycoplasma anserisalpingitidis]|uniref:triose-phosphate isomerase n=1 Tax=Mycoplasma anserisalpingitidis TaxID=519450 RepID=UPI0011B107A4|nr:triose-phosphate isomerase [Mycoplasma anserisalpingitidis]QDY87993.1 triose-phosphate isomerase [Mycoplasma anserisalpingitidis]UCU27028.1 triose-phosphate isomerase [Mycoplasma anserisalpingitidis]UCU27155.1 triose-phosphate isomerase [Mycoplasma anserisalpingitidis]